MELATLERLQKRCLHLFSVVIGRIFLKLAGNEDMHNNSDDFEFRPDPKTQFDSVYNNKSLLF